MRLAALFLLPILLSACQVSSRDDYRLAAVSTASHDFICPMDQIKLNSVREEHDPFTQRLRAITYEAQGCGVTRLYRADDEDLYNVVSVKELK